MDSKDPTPLSLCACTFAISRAKSRAEENLVVSKNRGPNIDPNIL